MRKNETIEGYRLSPQQRREWNRRQEGGGGRSVCLVRLEGEAEESRVRGSLNEVVKRQEILRSRYEEVKGMSAPVQVIESEGEVEWEEIDVRGEKEDEQEREVRKIYRQEREREVNYERASLVRAVMVMRAEGRADLVIGVPVISSDSVSLINLVKDFSCYYSGTSLSGQSPDEILQYADFSRWRNEMQEGEDAETARQLWDQAEIRNLWRLKLPFERKRCSPSPAFDSVEFTIGGDDRELIRRAVLVHQTTEDVILQAAWQATLWRLCPDHQEVCISRVTGARQHEMLQDAFGLYATEVPVSCRIDGGMELGHLINQIELSLSNGREWEDYFDIDRERERQGEQESERPVGFEYEEVGQSYQTEGLKVRILKLKSEVSRSKLLMRCEADAREIGVELRYDRQVYDRAAVEKVAGYMREMVKGLSRGERVWRVEILSEEERRELLYDLNRTEQEYEKRSSIQEMIERQAEEWPNRVAVVRGEENVSYGELNGRANRLARYLRSKGVGPEVQVGLCAERSVEMVVGLLGIIKAGGAYVPLDPAYPRERLSLMLQDIKATVIVTQQHLVRFLPDTEAEIIGIDSHQSVLAQESAANLEFEIHWENLAYVLFTSGSTGRPKGVMVEQGQLLNYVHSISERLDFPPEASFTTFSTFAADLGYTVIYPSLCLGGTLHLISPEQSLNPEYLAHYFSANGIDCLKTVPSHLKALQTIPNASSVMPRRRLVLGGEPSLREWVDGLLAANPECEIHNHYGPTEATVGVITYKVERNADIHNTRYLPLGRPIANTQIYILDPWLQPLSFGVAGELHIGGAPLARGYTGRPELTAERFIPNPFNDQSGARIYRTGDLAHYLPDGNLEFLGRNDDQLKVRGHRIEIGEIEAVLNSHPAVDSGAVLAKEDETGEKRLVAYIASNRQPEPTVNDIRAFLKERLPDHMIPMSIALLPALPLTVNGKLDRQSLLLLDESRIELARTYLAPRNVIEEALVRIWSDVLKVERIGVQDNFFDLGGHSLLAMQILSRLRLTFQIELPLRALFESLTVTALASTLVANESKPGYVEKVARALKKMENLSPEEMNEILQKRKAASDN